MKEIRSTGKVLHSFFNEMNKMAWSSFRSLLLVFELRMGALLPHPRNLNICHENLFVLQVGVPRRWLMDSVTVHCGHCNHLSFLNPRDVIQCLCPAGPQMGLQVHFPVHGTSLVHNILKHPAEDKTAV